MEDYDTKIAKRLIVKNSDLLKQVQNVDRRNKLSIADQVHQFLEELDRFIRERKQP